MSTLHEGLTDFYSHLEQAHLAVRAIKTQFDQWDVSEAAQKGLNIPKIHKMIKEIERFSVFPVKPKPAHRPVKYPDSVEEKKRFEQYKKQGLSLREIGERESLKKDVIAAKLKRYGIK